MRFNRKGIAIFGGIAGIFNFSSSGQSETLPESHYLEARRENTGEVFKNGWNLKTLAASGTRCSNIRGNSLRLATDAIEEVLNPKDLSPNCVIDFNLTASSDDFPHYEVLSQAGSAADLFYCEQAIWESSPYRLRLKGMSGSFVINAKKLLQDQSKQVDYFHKKLSSAESLFNKTSTNTVVIHVIPRSINSDDRFPVLFTEAELNGVQNLKSIPVTKLQSEELTLYRKEWATYIDSKVYTKNWKEGVLSFAAELLNKHSALFEKGE